MKASDRLVHEVSVWSPYIGDYHTPRCTCGWEGDPRQSELAAKVAAKEHRLETVVDDDVNVRRGPGRPKGSKNKPKEGLL